MILLIIIIGFVGVFVLMGVIGTTLSKQLDLIINLLIRNNGLLTLIKNNRKL